MEGQNMLDADPIQHHLETEKIGRTLRCLGEIESTNTECYQEGLKGASEGLVIVADYQRSGRGRLQRQWESPRGKNLLFSVLLRPSLSAESAIQLTLVAAVAFQKELENFLKIRAQVKWPNDLLINNLKVGGILMEMHVQKERLDFVVLGMGLNVNSEAKDFSEELRSRLTTLYKHKGEKIDRSHLLARLLNSFEKEYRRFLAGGWSGILAEYDKILAIKNKSVRVVLPRGSFEGKVQGVHENGALIVVNSQGRRELVLAGEIENLED